MATCFVLLCSVCIRLNACDLLYLCFRMACCDDSYRHKKGCAVVWRNPFRRYAIVARGGPQVMTDLLFLRR